MSETEADWVVVRPPPRIDAGRVLLTRVRLDDADGLVTAINESLHHLRPWMAWAREPATAQTMAEFVVRSDAAWSDGREFQYVMRRPRSDRTLPDPIVGACGLHARNGPGVLEIGYWVHVDHLREGIASAAADALTQAALSLRTVDRVEIHCDPANARSAAVPQRLGYRAIEASGALAWAFDRA